MIEAIQRFIAWLIYLPNRYRRHLDRKILWPAIMVAAQNRTDTTEIEPEELARRAFRTHMDLDSAYEDLLLDEMDDFVARLPWVNISRPKSKR